jgi:hypothetical protein
MHIVFTNLNKKFIADLEQQLSAEVGRAEIR